MCAICLLRSDSLLIIRSISKAMQELRTNPQFCQAAIEQLKVYVTECIDKYGDDYQYSTDPRLLKIWILYVTPLLSECQFWSYPSGFFCFNQLLWFVQF
jgi:hypothetical protein